MHYELSSPGAREMPVLQCAPHDDSKEKTMTTAEHIKSAGILLVLAGLTSLYGCTTLTVSEPANGSPSVSMPQTITVTESVGLDGRTQGPLKILVDGVDTERFNNVNYSVPSGSTLCCLAPGSHTISVSDRTSSGAVSASSSFTVTDCPACYTCPVGSAHPVFGVCCDNGSCDIPVSSNFGPWRFPTSSCPTMQIKSNDCLNQNANGICGPNGVGCAGLAPMATQMLAVSFSSGRGGSLRQIQVPIGWRNGSNAFRLWVTTDNGGKPGAIVEEFSLPNIRTWGSPFPTRSPMHIFSVAKPNLAAATTYWLVIGPDAPNTVGSWNYSPDDAPAAGSSNFLVNTTPSNGLPRLAGPWAPAGGPLRPAFEIDIR